jgi:hypothetical protein
VREYNFAIPGLVDRHVPGVPGMWPAGSRVTIDEDTNQVVKVMFGAEEILQLISVPVAPPAGENSPLGQTALDQLSEAMKNL